MIDLLLKYEVIYWLVAGITALLSFSLPGLLLLVIGNIFIRDGFSFARGLSVLWFVAAAAPLTGEPGGLQKVVGTAGIIAALVIYAFTYSRVQRTCQNGLLPAVYNASVLAVALFMLWTDRTLFGPVWVPAFIFLLVSLYSLLFQKNQEPSGT